MRKYLRVLFLLMAFQYFHLNANAQIDAPKWVDDIGGSSSNCISSGVRVDSQNNIYVAGFFSGTADFDPSPATYNLTAKGSFDAFVAKYTTNGKLIWAVSMGGSSLTQLNSMVVDKDGNTIVSGQFNSTDLDADPGSGTSILSSNGDYDAFIIKLNTNGGFVWAKSIGGTATDYGAHIVTDSQGNVIEDVRYQSTVQVGNMSFTAGGSQFNGLAVKYDPAGNVLWAVNIGDPGNSEVDYSTVDSQGNVLLSGQFQSNDNFNPLGSPSFLNANGGGTYIAKYTAAGSLIWVKSFSGPFANICVNSKNDIFIDGVFSSTINFNGTSLNPVGSQDLYLAKYSSSGDFEFAKDIGGINSSIYNYGIQSSQDDNIFISGYFSGTIDFDPSPTTAALISDHGQQDFFLTKYDENLNYKWAFNGGNPSCNSALGRAIIVDNNNDVLFTGGFCSTVNFSASACTPYPLTAQSSSRDCFLGKYSQNAASAAAQITGFSVPQQSAPAVIDQTNLKITVTVPYGTDITALKPSISYSSGVTLSPASGVATDFTAGATYTLSGSCASLNYAVNVVVAALVTNSTAEVCATPGNDGPTNITGSINTYFPGQANTTLASGANSIALLAVPPTDAYNNTFGSTAIKAGDLLLIVQMQDATISYSNDVLYGSNNANAGPDNLGATGFTDLGNSGRYEYVVATNSVPLTGGSLTFKGSGTGGGAVYTYVNADANATRGKRAFQIVRLPQYSNLRLSSNISPPPFNGNAGGIIAFSVAGNMDFNGYTIDVSGRGFRGGYSLIKATNVNIGDLYVTNADDYRASGKGEGVAGTPRYMWDGYNAVDNTIEGLPGGSDGRGAPANGGGGGNDVNSGGGGAGNGGFGGNGGWGYLSNIANGGRPGAPNFATAPDATRLIMGGGGGGGHANDALTGVKGGVGGGIVLINALSTSGTGTILANGSDGAPGVYGSHPDGSGGGGAGGTVFVQVSNPNPAAILTINAIGGKGGNTEGDDPATTGVQPHGPGGGGGGGQVFYAVASGTVNVNVAGGASGKTNSGAGITHNATDGSAGTNTKFTIASLPANLQGNGGACYPQLVTTMSVVNPGVTRYPGDVVNYIVKITNTSSGGSAGGVKANCAFPTGLSFVSATAVYTGTANGPAVPANTGTASLPLLGDFNIPFGDTAIVTLSVKLDCSTSGGYASNAQAVYLDPTRDYTQPTRLITAATNAFASVNTTYQTSVLGPVPGSNFSGTASSPEHIAVSNAPIAGNTITPPAISSFCTTGDASPIVGSTPTGGNSTYSYQWQSSADSLTFVNLPNDTLKDFDPPAQTSTVYYRRIVTSGACATPLNSNVIGIKILTQPIAPAATASEPVVCSGSPETLSVTSPQSGLVYKWFDSPAKTNLLHTGPTYLTGPITANTTFYVDAENAACSSASLTVVAVTVASLPNPPLLNTSSASVCYGTSIGFTDNTPQNGYFNWYTVPTGGTPIATGESYNTPPLTADITYYLESVNNFGCVNPNRTRVDIFIIPLPAAPQVQSPVSVCSGSAAVLAVSNPQSALTYNWYADQVSTNPLFSGSTYTTPAITAATTYYVEAVSNNGGCSSARTAVQVNIAAPPSTPVPLVATENICAGSPASLSVANPQAGTTYNWYDSAAKTNLLFTGPIYVTGNLNGPATFYVDAENGTCISPSVASVQVNISPLPAAPSVTNSGNLQACAGSAITLSIANPVPGITYNWYTVSAGGTQVGTGTSYTSDALQGSNTTYYVEAVNSAGCASSPRTAVPVTINNVPAAPTVTAQGGASPSVCSGSAAILTASSSTTNVTFNWYTAATGGTPVFTGATYTTPAITAAVTYYVEAVNSSSCTSVTRTAVPVIVTTPPATPVPSFTETATCTGSPATLSVSNPQAGIIYNWYDSATKTNLLYTGASYTTGPINAATNFYVDAESGSCASPSLASVQVNVLALPSSPAITFANQTCIGSAATMSVLNAQSDLTYNWYTTPSGGTPIYTGTSYTVNNVTANATYYIDAVNTNGCVSQNRGSANIVAVSSPSAPLVPTPPAICTGSATTLTITSPQAGLTYNWYDAATGGTPVFTGTSFTTPALSATTTYYADASNTGACTSARTPVQVTVNQPPATPVPALAAVSTCSGSPATLSVNNPQAGITYNWYDSAAKTNLLFTGATYTTGAISANTTFYVDAENGSCASQALAGVQVSVLTPPAPPAVINNTPQVCPQTQVSLSVANPQNGYSYNWYTVPSGGVPIYTVDVITINGVTNNTTFYLEATSPSGCVSLTRTRADITVIPAPDAPTIPAPAAICSGSSAVINVVATPQSSLTYNWYDAPTGGTLLFTGQTYTTQALTANTSYYVEAVNASTCVSPRATVQVTVNQPPATPTVSAATQTVCYGSPATLSVANPQTGVTYNWYDSAAKTNLLFTGTSYVTAALTANATYYVDAENSSCASPSAASVQVSISAAPSAPVITNTTPQVCAGSTATLSVSNPQAGITYNWYTSATASAITFTGTNFVLNNLTANAAYFVEAVNSNNCSSPTRTEADITVNAVPAVPQVQAAGSSVCVGSGATLNISNAQPGLTYNWYAAATGGSPIGTGSSFTTPALTATTTYYAEAVNTSACTSASRSAVTVTANQPPAVPVPVLATQTVCTGNTATLSVANPQSNLTYSWYDSASKTNLLSTGPSYITSPLTTSATYYVEAVNGSCPSPSLASVQVNVNALPTTPVVDQSTAQACYGSLLTFNIVNPQNYVGYNWYTTASGGTPIYSGTPFVTPAITANITFYAEAVNSNNCISSARTPVSVTLLASPAVPQVSTQGTAICPGSSATLTATTTAGNTIQWFATNTGGTALFTGNSFTTPVLTGNTTYYAGAENSNSCSSPTRAAATVTMLQQLDAPVVALDAATSTSITFKWDAVSGATGYLVSIDNGLTFNAPSSGSDGLTDEITGLHVGDQVTIIVRAAGNSTCELSGSSTAFTATATYPQNDIIYVANAFTPNGDGKNDRVYVHSESIRTMTFYVYDQWGELLFRSSDQSVGWDGTYKGTKEPVGVYVYYVQAIMTNGDKITKKGTITLLR